MNGRLGVIRTGCCKWFNGVYQFIEIGRRKVDVLRVLELSDFEPHKWQFRERTAHIPQLGKRKAARNPKIRWDQAWCKNIAIQMHVDLAFTDGMNDFALEVGTVGADQVDLA